MSIHRSESNCFEQESEKQSVQKFSKRIRVCQTETDWQEIVFRLHEEKRSGKKIALFGAGKIGRLVFELLRKDDVSVDFFIDNDPEKAGTRILDIPVYSLDDLKSDRSYVVVLAAFYYREMLSQLYQAGLLNLTAAVFCGESRFFQEDRKTEQLHRIDSSGKVVFDILEVDIVRSCNLKCKHCSHFSPYRKGIYETEEIVEWFRSWSPKLRPQFLRILGGEPLLHPDLETILLKAKEYWPDSQIQLITNARRLEAMPDSLFDALKSTDAEIEISRHLDNDLEKQYVAAALTKIDQADLRCYVAESFLTWNTLYRIDSEGRPEPHGSNAEKAFRVCTVPACRSINGNRFHRCTIIANAYAAYTEGVLDAAWDFLAREKFLDPDCSAEDILQHLNSGPYRSCTMCPEKDELFFSTEQICTKKRRFV